MGKLLIAAGLSALVAAAGCQPMYSTRSEPIKNPKVIPQKKNTTSGPPIADNKPPPVEIEDCDWRVAPLPGKGTVGAKRDIPSATASVQRADITAGKFDKEPNAKTKGDLLIDSIQAYNNALVKDPYNADATLKLAVAYDKAQRKGCALALLDRLRRLSEHPTYQQAANEKIDEVDNHKSWFGPYRNDAMKKLGR